MSRSGSCPRALNRNVALDYLKLAMAGAVVGLHVGFLADFSMLAAHLTANGLFRMAVPIFLLINGYYFFAVASQGRQLAWLRRVALLYVFWMAFYAFFWVPSMQLTPAGIAEMVFFGYHHLWYVAGLLGAAIVLLGLRTQSSATLLALALASFVIGVVIQYVGHFQLLAGSAIGEFAGHVWSHRNQLFFAFPFFALGFLIRKHAVTERISTRAAAVLAAVGVAALLAESLAIYQPGVREGGFDNFASLLVACPAIFLLTSKCKRRGDSKEVSLYASAIYFIHPLVLMLLVAFADLGATMLTLVGIVLSAAVSYPLVRFNRRVRFML